MAEPAAALIKIAGGLPDVMHVILGPRWRLDALPGEPVEVFEIRALTAAEAVGGPGCVWPARQLSRSILKR
jgi:hypothetical protein